MKRKSSLVVAVDQFFGRGSRCRQDTKPCKRENALILCQISRDGWAAYTVKSIAARDKIAENLRGFPMIVESNLWGCRIDVMNTPILDLEQNLSSRFTA